MQVILLERLRRLGNIGEEVKVKDGYGRNYLLPQGKALRATEKNRKLFVEKKSEYEKRNQDKKILAEKEAENIQGLTLEIVSAAQVNGKLYGSITVRDLANHLQEQGHNIQRSHIAMPKPISETGIYQIKIILHPEVSTEITVAIAGTQDEVHHLLSPEEEEEQKTEEGGANEIVAPEDVETIEDEKKETSSETETETE